jgi:hypothetical protein
MEKDSVGIKSLHERLTKLEEANDIAPDNSLLQKMKNIDVIQQQNQKDNKLKQLDDIKTKYSDGLASNGIEPTLPNLPKLIEYSVQFVEQFHEMIAKIMDVVLTNPQEQAIFKLETCFSIVTEFIETDSDLIKNLINQTVTLLFNKTNYTQKVEDEKLKRKGK